MQIAIFVTLALMAVLQFTNAQSFDQDDESFKLQILDIKFRTRVSLQPTAFVFNREADGVELGCYGYIKDGRPVRMFYVFDVKDYRFITTTMRFLVHPLNGKKKFAILTPKGRPDKEKAGSEVMRFPEQCL